MPTRAPARPYTPPPQITVQPPAFTIGDSGDALRQLVVILDTETGALAAELWHERRSPQMPTYHPHRDLYFPGAGHAWWNREARRIGWTPTQYATCAATEAGFRKALDLMARWAKELVDALEPLPDGGYDWTLKATAAHERILHLIHNGGRPLTDKTPVDDPWHGDGTAPLPDRHHYGAVSFDEIIAVDPGWVDPAWAAMTDAELDVVADGIISPFGKGAHAKWLSRATEDRLKATIVFHRRRMPDRLLSAENQGLPLHPVGVRAGLRRWRAAATAAAQKMPAEHALRFLTAHPEAHPVTLRAATTDHELDLIAERLNARAAHEYRVALIETRAALAATRTELRTAARAELAAAGDAYAAAAIELGRLGHRRAALLHEVAAFQDGPEWDPATRRHRYAELGRLAGMTRQAVQERLSAAGEPHPDQGEGDGGEAGSGDGEGDYTRHGPEQADPRPIEVA